jgi:hypothetical protein
MKICKKVKTSLYVITQSFDLFQPLTVNLNFTLFVMFAFMLYQLFSALHYSLSTILHILADLEIESGLILLTKSLEYWDGVLLNVFAPIPTVHHVLCKKCNAVIFSTMESSLHCHGHRTLDLVPMGLWKLTMANEPFNSEDGPALIENRTPFLSIIFLRWDWYKFSFSLTDTHSDTKERCC